MSRSGTILCLASAAGFGTMAIFGKLAFDNGASLGTALALRFAIAAALFWALVVARREVAGIRAIPRRDVTLALVLGACGYATQAGLYFAALERIDASLLSLLLYTFPAMVTVAAIVTGRERFDGRRLTALVLASCGLALVLAGAGTGALDPLGTVLGLGAAVVYSAYILVSESISGRVRPLLLAALVCTGAAVTLTSGAALVGALQLGDVTLAGWGWLASLSAVSTVGAITLFFAGLSRVGPSAAAILSTVEPLVTVVLAFLVFGEVLGLVQIAGGMLVLGAVVALRVPLGRVRLRRQATAPAPAQTSAP